jgi:hypothetical protein
MRWSARTRAEDASGRSKERHGPCLNHVDPWVQTQCPCTADRGTGAIVEVRALASTTFLLSATVVVVVVAGRCVLAVRVMT